MGFYFGALATVKNRKKMTGLSKNEYERLRFATVLLNTAVGHKKVQLMKLSGYTSKYLTALLNLRQFSLFENLQFDISVKFTRFYD